LERTEQVVERIVGGLARVEERFGRDQPGGSLVRQVVVQYDRNPDAFDSGPHLATITADLLGAERRSVTIDQIAGAWRDAVGQPADVIGLTYKEPFLGPAGQAIELRLIGQDLDRLARAADALRDWLAGYEGAQDLIHDLRPGKPELRLTLRDSSRALGLDGATVAAQLRAAFQGVTAREFQRGRESYEIDLRLGALDRGRLGALDEFTLTGRDGALVPLEVVARLEPVRGFGRVQRIDGERVATVRGDIDAARANAAAIVADTRARFAPVLQERFAGIRLEVAGQDQESARTGASLLRGFLIGLTGIFLLLSFLFRSYAEPLVVMVAIPLALIGVIWGHLLMGLELSMPSVIGFASLAGIVVNNSILLVAFVKRNHATGMSVPEAARLASRQRLRAVLLTSLTTIAGLLPLLTETSLQAQVLIPLVTSLAFGLMASSLLVLVLVPALYALLDDLGVTALSDRRAAEHRALAEATPEGA
jgi:hydrophobic/amphiphilic exporter-1 (mainly G- bacteria), HAE1 family